MWQVTAPAFNAPAMGFLTGFLGCLLGMQLDYHEKDMHGSRISNLTMTQDVEKAKPELWGRCGREAVPGTTSMERNGGAAPYFSPTLVI